MLILVDPIVIHNRFKYKLDSIAKKEKKSYMLDLFFFFFFFWVNKHDIKQQKKLQTGHRGQSSGYLPITVQTIDIRYK